MTIASATVATSGSACNGATVTFSFSFSIAAYGAVLAEDQVQVILETIATGARSLLTRGTSAGQYSVSINGDQSSSPGGSITTISTYSSSYKIWIRLAPSFLQSTSLVNQGAFQAATVMGEMDQQARQINVLADRVRRAAYLDTPAGSSFSGEITGPFTVGYAVIVNGAGTGFTLGAAASVTVSAAMTPVVTAATLAAGRSAFAVPGLGDDNVFTKTAKWTIPYTTMGDSIVEITHGSSGNPVTTVDAKYSGIRVERYLNKTAGASSTQEASVQADALSAGAFIARKTSASQQTFALKGIATIGTPRTSGIGSNTDTVGVYGEAQRTTGSDAVWAANFLCEVTNLNGASIGVEIDFNNRSTSDPGLTGSIYALSIVNGDQYRGGTAIIVNRNGGYSNNEFNRGIFVKEFKKIGVEIGNIWAGGTNAMLLGNQNLDGEDCILLRRTTDSSPTGYFFRAVNFANNANLITWGIDGALSVASSIKSSSATAGIGYGTGAGGTVTQLTNRSTGVTLNKIAGQVVTDSTSLAAEAAATFTVTNSAVAITDTVVLSIRSGANGGNTAVAVTTVTNGSFDIKVSNNNAAAGTAETGAIAINFAVVKSVTS